MDVPEEETHGEPRAGGLGSAVDLRTADDATSVGDASSALVFRAFQTALRLHRQLMLKTLTARGAHPGQAFCLRLLAAHDGATQRDMAETLHLSRPTVTKMLQAMERSGMVERRPDATDQRLTRVYLTPAGRDRERELAAVASDYVKQTIGTLSENDRRELARLLDELSASISRALAATGDPVREGADLTADVTGTPPDVAEAAS